MPLGRPVTSALILGRCSDEVALSDFSAYRTENCEGSCRVEIEIRQRKIQQKRLPREFHFARTEFENYLLVFGAVNLLGPDALDKHDSFGDARLQSGKTRLVCLECRRGCTGKLGARPAGMNRHLLYLPGEREHIRIKPCCEQISFFNLFCLGKRGSLIEYRRHACQEL